MPRITSVHVLAAEPAPASGLKGALFSQDFGPCTLLVGPNGAGKTTRGPLAVTAAIEGLATVPTDPRRPYIGASPTNTLVRLALDNGRTVERDLAAQRGAAAANADGVARSLVGVPPTAWDLSDFAAGTSGDRGKILDAVARAGGTLDGWTGERCVAWIEGRMDDSIADVVAEIPPVDDGAAWLRLALAWAERHQSECNARQRDLEGASRAAAARLAAAPATADVAALDAEIERLAALLATDTAVVSHAAEGARLRAAIHSGRTLVERYRQPEPEPAPLVRMDPIAPPSTPRPDPSALKAAERAAQATVDKVVADWRDADRQRQDAERQATQAEARAVTHDGDALTCIHCGAADPLGRSRIRDRVLAEAAQHRAAAQELTARVAELVIAGQAARAEHRKAADALASAEADIRTWDAQQRESTSRAAAIAQAEAAHDRAVESWRAREARRLDDLAHAEGALQTTQDLLADWQLRVAPVGAPEGTREALDDLRLRRETARAAAQARAESEAAFARYDDARAAWDRSRALVQAVRDTRDEMARAAYQPIHDAATALLAGTEGLPVPYFRGADDFGAIIRGRRVAFAGLSESEGRITAAALVYALATVSRCPVRLVLLDGLEVVQRDHRGPLLAALSRAAQAGLVDTVIATMATAPGEDISDLTNIDGLTVSEVTRE